MPAAFFPGTAGVLAGMEEIGPKGPAFVAAGSRKRSLLLPDSRFLPAERRLLLRRHRLLSPASRQPGQIGAAQLAQPVAMARALHTSVIFSRLRLPMYWESCRRSTVWTWSRLTADGPLSSSSVTTNSILRARRI